MSLTFYTYPNCSTCRKAKKWFDQHGIEYTMKHIVEETPTKEEILLFFKLTDEPARRFFNTSGRVYRDLNMKDKIDDATEDEMAAFLASDGMLIRRPIVTDGQKVTIGFKADTYEQFWLPT